jgi:MFS family permease
MIVSSTVIFGCSIGLFALSRSLFVAVPALVLAGFGVTTMFASCNTIIQTIVEEDKRGRVMSFYAMSFAGMIPFGSLIAGFLARCIGARETVLLGGICSLAGAAFFAWKLPGIRKMVRPVYQRMGILPDVDDTLETVAK